MSFRCLQWVWIWHFVKEKKYFIDIHKDGAKWPPYKVVVKVFMDEWIDEVKWGWGNERYDRTGGVDNIRGGASPWIQDMMIFGKA